MNTSIENIVCVHRVTKKRVFEQLMSAVACSAHRHPASREVSLSGCDVTGRRVKVESMKIRSILKVALLLKAV